MQKMLSDLLHVDVEECDYDKQKNLPLFLSSSYQIKQIIIADINILFVKPKAPVTFSALKKHWKKFEQLTEMPCVIFDDSYARYGKKRMIEMGIPFVFGDNDIYLPFLGVALSHKRSAALPEVETFSPATQKMILTALYEGWELVPTKEIGERLQFSRMTAGRCLMELQALGLPLTETRGKTKYYVFSGSKKMLYDLCAPCFINPVVRTLVLKEVPDNVRCLGGISALAHYSMLADDKYPTYALSREEYTHLQGKEYELCPQTETPACRLQILRYKIEQDDVIDPLSAVLCVSEQDRKDPRIEDAVETILEDLWNG